MSTTNPHRIQEFRFYLKPEALANETIAYLHFPWETAVNDFITYIEKKRGESIDYEQYPTFQALNLVLSALSTTLVHGFEKYTLEDEDEDEGVTSRFMLVPADAPRPTVAQIAIAVQPWLKAWVEHAFKKELDLDNEVRQAYQDLLAKLQTPEYDWEIVAMRDLLPNHPFIYQAIPSLLAKYLLNQTEELNIAGNNVELRLTKETGKGSLSIVSQPLGSEIGDSFAYSISFKIQTVPGDLAPLIQLHIRCRRYMQRKVTKLNYKRKSTVLVSLKTPLLPGWPFDSTLVPLQVSQKAKKFFWDDTAAHLLKEVSARDLIDVDQLAKDPDCSWWFSSTSDNYYWIYAEGMKYKHKMGSGFSPGELYEVWQHIVCLTADILEPVGLIEHDVKTHDVNRPVAMLTTWELTAKDSAQVPVFNEPKKRRKITKADIDRIKSEALKRAIGTESPYTLMLYRTERGRSVLGSYARDCLPAAYPDTHVIEQRLEDSLTAQFPPDAPPRAIEERKNAFNTKVLKSLNLPKDNPALALVEVPPENLEDDDKTVKGIIRAACLSRHIGSQLFVQPKGGEGDTSRAKNSVTDLFIRQTGIVYGDIRDIYHLAEIPADIANELTVIGLYRRRTTGERAIDFPLAVRLLPTGRIEMCWPEHPWTHYFNATLDLGEFFRRYGASRRNRLEKLKLEKQTIAAFVEQVCLDTVGPTLVLAEAHDFRGAWPLLQNPNLQYNELTLPSGNILKPGPDSELWVIRLRSSESEETPQYVRVVEDELGNSKAGRSADGLYRVGMSGQFPIFHSIGKMPKMTSYQKDYEPKTGRWGGKTAYKHQRILEIIPIFMQKDDNIQAWARLVHFLRYTPAWTEGRTVLPLPNHLAVNALEDMLCLL